ncbi:hypothetical protein [Hyalangium minutum]|uniref:Lipoprotein n=1 Tax=Hyalangium minutum TaxID=394096 RepID=A0A085W7U1_9BACT|nr:hypothetical protein [Hyalangium minutum]KFE63754.1 hypothetical protein DB31_2522 [Hyalangium minutum]
MMKGRFSAVLLMAFGLVGLSGCKSECRAYCERYQQCVEDDINVSTCTNTCQDASDSNRDHEAKVRECANCVGSRSCAATFDDCIDDCFGVQGP